MKFISFVFFILTIPFLLIGIILIELILGIEDMIYTGLKNNFYTKKSGSFYKVFSTNYYSILEKRKNKKNS